MILVTLYTVAGKVGYRDVAASMERLVQELGEVRHRFGDDVQNLWKSIHMVCKAVGNRTRESNLPKRFTVWKTDSRA